MLANSPLLSPIGVGAISNSEPAFTAPPTIDVQPVDVLWATGMTYTFTSQVSDFESIQWYRNGVPYNGLSGGDSEDMLVRFAPEDNGANYYFIANNSFDSVQSNTVTVSLRHRIYMNWTLVPEFQTTQSNAFNSVRFRDDGTIFTETAGVDTWVSSVGHPDLPPFDISDYEVKLVSVSGEAIAEPPILFDFVEMYDLIYVRLNISSVPINESRNYSVQIRDKLLPEFNWAGWDTGTLFYRKVTAASPSHYSPVLPPSS